ncbi:MAG: hypothetical protein CMG64_06955 [Candidatus Marinimicrobia bacterium]|nr:hypothetical protein [Candidatus Neomarinimicrobiota bacterium]
MVRKKSHRRKKIKHQQHISLNIAIGIVGVLLLGFIYSFTQNSSHHGIPVEVTFPVDQPRELAANVYERKPIHKIKVEILNGCGIKGIAAKTAEFLHKEYQIDVVKSDNADSHNYPNTLIIGRNEKIEGLQLLSQSFGVPFDDTTIVQHSPNESLGIDVTVILGKDIKTYNKIFDYISSKK